ncbi:hypothetical protein SALBM311S_00891 [Streptomyces alboniger]
MATAREQLRALVAADDPFGQPGQDTRELQLEAAREAFAAHRERVPLLRTRAEETDVREITGFEDLVPLLFSHTSYKSYPLSLITGGRWDRLLRWYATVSAVEPEDVDIEGVNDIDEWTERVTAAGHRPYITSGTSGKVSFLNCDASDLSFLHDILEHVTGQYRVRGGYEGRGLVIRSPEPVDFHPDGKIVDVVPVGELSEAVRHAGVATQTVGAYPTPARPTCATPSPAPGCSAWCPSAGRAASPPGLSHDGF